MDEGQIIERIRRKAPRLGRSGVVLGIGDDCAIFRQPSEGDDLLFTTDMFLEDVHFLRNLHPPEAAGYKALARGLSDIAAMGGRPRFFLVSIALAPWVDDVWVDRFYDGVLDLASRCSVVLAGGDLSHGARVTCDIVVCGSVPRGKALRRDGARPGDLVYVSGELGGASLGLETQEGVPWERHLHPVPRLELGQYLRKGIGANSAMDLSDGLSSDLRRLANASGLSAAIDAAVPACAGASLEQVLHGGDDYELLFTVSPGVHVPSAYRGVALTKIGVMREGVVGNVEYFGKPLKALGYDHFLP